MTLYFYIKDRIAHCEKVARETSAGSVQSNMMAMRDAYEDILRLLTVEDASKEVEEQIKSTGECNV